jgi:flagellar assembly protein FliH
LKETQGRVDQALAAFQQAVGQLRERQQKTLDEAQQELIDIAFEMAAKVVQTEIQTHPEVVLSAVQSALSRFKGGDIVLRLHPEDAETVRGALLRLTSELSSGTTISIAEDPTVERGGCVADGEGGRVDNQPSVKLELLHQAVST